MISLIARLSKAPERTIFIDNRPIEEIPLKILRSSIGYVSQESFLFSGSIRENICFGVPEASEELLERASIIADIKKDIDEFPRGYEMLVGERGVTLSGGQKARVALAKCLLSGASVIFLDEPTNHLDLTSIQVMESALEYFPGAVIFVSHDQFFIDKVKTRSLEFVKEKQTPIFT